MKDVRATEMAILEDQWRKSGKSLTEFCQLMGISKNKLKYWVYAKSKNLEKPSRSATVDEKCFVEIFSKAKPITKYGNLCEVAKSGSQPSLEITFPSGMCVKIFG